MTDISRYSINDGIAILLIDNEPVNALSNAVRQAIVDGIKRFNADPDAKALVITGAGKVFCAGADVKEFAAPAAQPYLPDVVDTIEASSKPVVAAIHGAALGGGLEVAMACHYRIARPDAKLGLPEVKLGLMPGARGTQLLPRLIGIEKSLEMIALGEPICGDMAAALGLVDALADGDVLEAATNFARSVQDELVRRTRDLPVKAVSASVFDAFAARHARRFRGLDAPQAILRSVRAAGELPFDDAARLERETFLELRTGPQREALSYAFFAEREAGKISGLVGAAPRAIAKTGVIGSGTMGVGIAIALLTAGFQVLLVERDEFALERGIGSIRAAIESNIRNGRMTAQAGDAALQGLTHSLHMESLRSTDLIIEAAYETMEVKQAIFAELNKIANPNTILASNTSYLDIDAIAASTSRQSNVLGLHFFSPANIMKLVEIVRGRYTAPDVLRTALDFVRRLEKVPVVSGNAYGFIGNRMLAVRRRHAEEMLIGGAPPTQIDAVLERFGMPMGPFRMADLAGLDLGWSADRSTGSTIRERFCEAGRRGQKTNAGFYDYGDGKPLPSTQADEIIARFASDTGVARRTFDDEEILDRLLWPMVDEGAQLLSEGIAQRASDIDVVWLNGYGWPAWTGGPMFHARRFGLQKVCSRLEEIGIRPSAAFVSLSSA